MIVEFRSELTKRDQEAKELFRQKDEEMKELRKRNDEIMNMIQVMQGSMPGHVHLGEPSKK